MMFNVALLPVWSREVFRKSASFVNHNNMVKERELVKFWEDNKAKQTTFIVEHQPHP